MKLDERRVREILDLDSLNLPDKPRVIEIKFEPMIDSIGDRALQVWVIMEDKINASARTWRSHKIIEGAIHDALLQNEIDLFPYINFRTRAQYRRQMSARV